MAATSATLGTAARDAASVKSRRLPRVTGRDLRALGARVIPPLVVLAAFLLFWEVACSRPTAGLPPPSRVLSEAWPIISDPFFDNGGTDKGLFWHILASLQRVALGFALAVVAGVMLGTLVGQSEWAMRGLDPVFQVLRTIPPLAWLPLSLAAFRDGQPSAIFVIFITSIWPIIINTAVGIRNIPQDYRNVAAVIRLNPLEFFWKIMLPSAAPTSSRACASASACPGSRSWRPRC